MSCIWYLRQSGDYFCTILWLYLDKRLNAFEYFNVHCYICKQLSFIDFPDIRRI
jgi:hypothetical protein